MKVSSIEAVFVADIGAAAGKDVRIEDSLGRTVDVDTVGEDPPGAWRAIRTAANSSVFGIDGAVRTSQAGCWEGRVSSDISTNGVEPSTLELGGRNWC